MLRALILAGGESRRMGRNKALLTYYGQPQAWHLYRMLGGMGIDTFVSCREDQRELFEDLSLITDLPAYAGHGPVSGLLSAYDRFGGDWLLVGCDYPLLGEPHLQALITAAAGTEASAVAWKNPDSGLPEPMPALYTAAACEQLKSLLASGQDSLRHYLQSSGAILLETAHGHFLQSVDTPEDYKRMIESLGG